jgi:hypothetical protein
MQTKSRQEKGKKEGINGKMETKFLRVGKIE